VADRVQFIEPKPDGDSARTSAPRQSANTPPPPADDDIPF
jgi:hypothetical protein